MTEIQPFNTTFTLNKDYLAECFDQSLPHGKNAKPNYIFPVLLAVAGAVLLVLTAQPKVIGTMFIALALLELLHIRFRRAWWLTRQMWGRSAGSEVTLTLDDNGVETKSVYAHTSLLWSDVGRVIETELGLILVAKAGGQHYLSKSLLTADMVHAIISRCEE